MKARNVPLRLTDPDPEPGVAKTSIGCSFPASAEV